MKELKPQYFHAILLVGQNKEAVKNRVFALASGHLNVPNLELDRCPDFLVIDALEGVEAVRGGIARVRLTSMTGAKMVWIDNLELSQAAVQNSLLKTLEEPSGNTLLVISASSTEGLLPTVLSRLTLEQVRGAKEAGAGWGEIDFSPEDFIAASPLAKVGMVTVLAGKGVEKEERGHWIDGLIASLERTLPNNLDLLERALKVRLDLRYNANIALSLTSLLV